MAIRREASPLQIGAEGMTVGPHRWTSSPTAREEGMERLHLADFKAPALVTVELHPRSRRRDDEHDS